MATYYVNITEEELEDLNSVSINCSTNGGDKLCIVNDSEYHELRESFEEFRDNTRSAIASEVGTVVASLQDGLYPVQYSQTTGAIKDDDSSNMFTYDDIYSLMDGKEDKSNKIGEWNDTPNSDSYPNETLVKGELDNKVNNNQMTTVINQSSDNSHFPTAKTVYEYTRRYVEPTDLVNLVYPVGSIYMSVNSANPGSLFGGTWEKLEDRFLLGASSTYPVGEKKGSATHTLIESEMPKHTHTQVAHTHSTHDGNFFLTSKDNIATNTTKRKIPATDSNGWCFVHDVTTNPSGIGENQKNGKAQKTVTDTVAKNNYTGGGQPHNNMPPYLSVYMWKRIR